MAAICSSQSSEVVNAIRQSWKSPVPSRKTVAYALHVEIKFESGNVRMKLREEISPFDAIPAKLLR